jgi:hypothetical protein
MPIAQGGEEFVERGVQGMRKGMPGLQSPNRAALLDLDERAPGGPLRAASSS